MFDFNLGNSTNHNDLCCNQSQLIVIISMSILLFIFLLTIAYKYIYNPIRVSSRQGYMNIDRQNNNIGDIDF
jgi:hypothetical protein